MSSYSNLWQAIWPGVCDFYDAAQYDFENNPGTVKALQARVHSYQLLLIELLIHEQRKKFATPFEPLDGQKALHYIVFNKTHWELPKIRSLSLQDILFVLLDDIRPDHLPDEAQKYLETLRIPSNPPAVDLMQYSGWQIGEGQRYLKDQQ